MSFDDIAEKKAALRKAIRAERRGLTDEQRRASALAVAEKLVSLEALSGKKLILAYMPMKYELDILPAVEMLGARGAQAAFPLCIEDGGLRLFVPPVENGFKVGAYGILEPDIEASHEVDAGELDAILLPAIGFDRQGRRLGQGGGYYDRLLARTDCLKIAVGFDCQLIDEVPTEETDKIVDIVVTPGVTLVI